MAEDTVEQRMKKNLIERENWYKQNEKNDDDEENEKPNKFRKTNTEEAVAMPRKVRPGIRVTRSETETQWAASSPEN